MKNIILGDGITGYVIAACLNYNNKNFIIYGDGNYHDPTILLLKYKNYAERDFYLHLFEIEITPENIGKYTRRIKVGYTIDNTTIVDTPTQEMIGDYYTKQNRIKTNSSMSDSVNSFDAIDLRLVYEHLKNKYSKKVIKKKVDIDTLPTENVNIYNTIFQTKLNNYEPSIEYVSASVNDTKGYDYIYNCSKFSRVKRITPGFIEYESNPGLFDFTIKNYYNEPEIYVTHKPKSNFTWIDISRKATKTQLKQEDIIKYMLGDIK